MPILPTPPGTPEPPAPDMNGTRINGCNNCIITTGYSLSISALPVPHSKIDPATLLERNHDSGTSAPTLPPYDGGRSASAQYDDGGNDRFIIYEIARNGSSAATTSSPNCDDFSRTISTVPSSLGALGQRSEIALPLISDIPWASSTTTLRKTQRHAELWADGSVRDGDASVTTLGLGPHCASIPLIVSSLIIQLTSHRS